MGELTRHGTSRPATQDDLDLYSRAQTLQALQQVPFLRHAEDRHEYLFFVLFDGTGQDVTDPNQLPTNIGVLKKQLDALKFQANLRIGVQYVEGVGTQHSLLARAVDGAVPYTWDEKIEKAYRGLATQAKEWKVQNLDAQIRVAEVGYSRGAVLADGLARLVDEYGIVDPDDLRFGRGADGNVTVHSSRPPLVAPGDVAQAMGLYDPVATNMPRNYDARRPPSVISALALAARDEDRLTFPHEAILEPGLSPDRRFANVLVPGGHSNVGGGNREYGLEVGAFNLMADYLNGLSDKPFLDYRPLPADPVLYTVYQAHGATAIPGMDKDALRDLRLELVNCKVVDPCRVGEPVDAALANRFEYRRLQPLAPMPALSPREPEPRQDDKRVAPSTEGSQPARLPPSDPAHPDHAMLERIRSGVRAIDRQAGKDYDDASERLSRSLLAASKDNRDMYSAAAHGPLASNALHRIDHVVMGTDGRYAFVVQGDLRDPAHKRAHVEVATAIQTPIGQSDAKLDAANRQITQELQLARQHELQRQHDAPAQGIPLAR